MRLGVLLSLPVIASAQLRKYPDCIGNSDYEGWKDIHNRRCSEYDTALCASEGNTGGKEDTKFKDVTANEACIVCGACDECSDYFGFEDDYGDNCEVFANDNLFNEYYYDDDTENDALRDDDFVSYGQSWCSTYGNIQNTKDNISPNEACCICGGGARVRFSSIQAPLPTHSPTVSPTRAPTSSPTSSPTNMPTLVPTPEPTNQSFYTEEFNSVLDTIETSVESLFGGRKKRKKEPKEKPRVKRNRVKPVEKSEKTTPSKIYYASDYEVSQKVGKSENKPVENSEKTSPSKINYTSDYAVSQKVGKSGKDDSLMGGAPPETATVESSKLKHSANRKGNKKPNNRPANDSADYSGKSKSAHSKEKVGESGDKMTSGDNKSKHEHPKKGGKSGKSGKSSKNGKNGKNKNGDDDGSKYESEDMNSKLRSGQGSQKKWLREIFKFEGDEDHK